MEKSLQTLHSAEASHEAACSLHVRHEDVGSDGGIPSKVWPSGREEVLRGPQDPPSDDQRSWPGMNATPIRAPTLHLPPAVRVTSRRSTELGRETLLNAQLDTSRTRTVSRTNKQRRGASGARGHQQTGD